MNISRYDRACMHLGIKLYDPELFKQDDKHDGKFRIGEAQILYMLNRTQSMFKYKKLPETIPSRNLEIMLQLNGNVFFTKVEGEYYVFTGGLGGEPDVYYEPTIYTVANPALNFSKNLKIDVDGVLIRSDAYGVGLLPMMQKYAALMVENEVTMRVVDINSRIPFILSASDDRTLKSAILFLQHIIDGDLGTISENNFLEDLKVNTVGGDHTQRMTDLIEYQQYLKAAWFNDLGINANYNMKRESISPDEAQLNDDALLPLIDDMIEERKRGLKKVNEMYGLDIEVDLDSSWLNEQNKQTQVPAMSPGIENIPESPDDVAASGDSPSQIDENDDEIETEQTDTTDSENVDSEDPEESPDDNDSDNVDSEDPENISEDLQEIKEDLQEIKNELEIKDDDEDSET